MAGERCMVNAPGACGAHGSTTAANGLATCTLGSCSATEAWYGRKLGFSCAGDPDGGRIVITDGVITQYYDLEKAGPGVIDLGDVRYAAGVAPTITIDDGSANSSVSLTPTFWKGPLV